MLPGGNRYNLTEAGDGTGADVFDNEFRLRSVDISALLAAPDDETVLTATAAELGPVSVWLLYMCL